MGMVPMKLSFWALLGWVLPVGLLAGGVGAAVTWWAAGPQGLTAEFLAGAVVLPVMIVSALIVVAVAAYGPAVTTLTFVSVGVVRLTAVMAVGLIVYRYCRPGMLVFWVWVAVFYLAVIAAEVAWLTRALKRDARDVAVGRIDRPAMG